jgi:hypothetical protein
MISITGEMRDRVDSALSDRVPCFVGTASKEGMPQISMKGSVLVYDEGTLAYWERARRTALKNVSENPRTVVFYRNPQERISWRFHGTATVHESGPTRDAVMERTIQQELDRDPDREGVAVLVKIDLIDELSGNVLQRRD